MSRPPRPACIPMLYPLSYKWETTPGVEPGPLVLYDQSTTYDRWLASAASMRTNATSVELRR